VSLLIVLRPIRPRTLILMCTALGAMLGIGFGIRSDVVMNLVPVALTVTAFMPGGVFRNIPVKAAALAALLLAFAVCASGVLNFYQSGHALWHVSILGLTEPFDTPLGIEPALYNHGAAYSDDVVFAEVIGYVHRIERGTPAPEIFTPAYQNASRKYYLTLARLVPADFFVRTLASVVKVLNLPYSITYGRAPIGVSHPLVLRLYEARAWCLTALEGVTPALLLAVAAGLTTRSRRCALALVALVLFYSGYPVLQFYGRHVFHLEFVALWIAAIAVSQAPPLLRRDADGVSRRREFLASLVPWTAAIAGIVAALAVVRLVQAGHVRNLISRYETAPREELSVRTDRVASGRIRLTPEPSLASRLDATSLSSEMLILRVGGTSGSAILAPFPSCSKRSRATTGSASRCISA
jgi:hypothetical protein